LALLPGDSLPASASEIEPAVGFDLLEPAWLPAGFLFSMAQPDPSGTKRVRLIYEYGHRSGIAAVVVFESLAGIAPMDLREFYPAGAVQSVSVGSVAAQYAQGVYEFGSATSAPGAPTPAPVWNPGDDHQALVWEKGEIQLELYFITGPSYDGPPLALADLIRIAESLK
jgi:hypothetical protein